MSCGVHGNALMCPICRTEVVNDSNVGASIVVEVTPDTQYQYNYNREQFLATRRRWIVTGIGMLMTMSGCVLVYWLASDATR